MRMVRLFVYSSSIGAIFGLADGLGGHPRTMGDLCEPRVRPLRNSERLCVQIPCRGRPMSRHAKVYVYR